MLFASLEDRKLPSTEIVISEDNRKDVEDIKPVYVEGLSFHYVKNIDDVIAYIFKD